MRTSPVERSELRAACSRAAFRSEGRWRASPSRTRAVAQADSHRPQTDSHALAGALRIWWLNGPRHIEWVSRDAVTPAFKADTCIVLIGPVHDSM